MRSAVTISMPEDLERRLDKIARQRHMKRSELVRKFIKRGLISEEIGLPPLTKREKFILSHIS